MITASHNPAEYNGLKFKASYGGSASPEIIADIEKYVRRLEAEGREFPQASLAGQCGEILRRRQPYLTHVKNMLDAKILSEFRGKIVFDMMHGAASGYAERIGCRVRT